MEVNNDDDAKAMKKLGLPLQFGRVKSTLTKKRRNRKGSKNQQSGGKKYSYISYVYDYKQFKQKKKKLKIYVSKDNGNQREKIICKYPFVSINLNDKNKCYALLLGELQRKVFKENKMSSLIRSFYSNEGNPPVTMNPIEKDIKDIKTTSEKDIKVTPKAENGRFETHQTEHSDSFAKYLKACGDLTEQQQNHFQHYFKYRYDLFSRFDEGIHLDYESWFSVTPEEIANHIAERLACNIALDGFSGVGGNTIALALTCDVVYAIDSSEERIRFAKNNAAIYGVTNIEFIVGDFFEVMRNLSISVDCIFMSPPWGGPEYSKKDVYDVTKMGSLIDGSKAIEETLKKTKNVTVFLPRNICHEQIMEVTENLNTGRSFEIEHVILNSMHKVSILYLGDIVVDQNK